MTGKRYLKKMYSITAATKSDEIRAIYDDWADEYENELVAEHDYAMPARAATMAARRITDPNALILDVGCGTGLSGMALHAEQFNRVDGCDLSPKMLDIARQRAIYGRLFEIDLLAPPMDVADGHYDAAIAVGAFATGHLDGDAVDEMLRITRPGGVVIITTNDQFYETSILQDRFKSLEENQLITDIEAEHGDHIPGKNIGGWVFAMVKTAP